MKDKIFLLETNVEAQNRSPYNPNSTYPLGLAYLDAVLIKEGIIKNELKDVYEKNHMILQNNPINTLFVLYTKVGFPKWLIKLLIKGRNNFILKKILSKTTFMWRAYNYITGFRDSIVRNDPARRKYFLLAPFKAIAKKLKPKDLNTQKN